MTFAAHVRLAAMAATLGACVLAMPGFAQTQGGTTPPLLPTPPQSPPAPPPAAAQAEPPAGAIGMAEMNAGGDILLHLKAPEHPTPEPGGPVMPLSAPQERMGYGEIVVDRLNPHYDELRKRLPGLAPGHDVAVWPWREGEEWHCAFDPFRGPCPGLHPVPNGSAQR